MWRLAVILLAIGAPAMAQDFDQAVRELLGDDPARYRAAIQGFQDAVRAGNGKAASAFVTYPIEVEVGGNSRIVRDAADFAAHFDEIVTPEVASRIQDEPIAGMSVSYQGVMLGQGEVWVSGVCLNVMCAGPAIRVVAIQSPVEALPPAVGTVKAFHDWRTGCDNRLGCTAIGLPPEGGSGAYVVLRLEAGASAEPSLDFVLADPGVAAATMRVEVEGEHGLDALELDAEADGAWLRARAPEADRGNLLAALRDGDRITLAAGDAAPVAVSLRGATAAMLMIDDRQWRIGTVSALARPGDAPAASVAPVPPVPDVDARPLRAIDGPPPVGVVADDDPSCANVAPVGYDLGQGRALWGACAIEGAYNAVYRFWTDGPDGLVPAVFDVPGRRDSAPALLTSPALTADGGAIEATNLGRGVGDCGEASRWAWTGDAFALVRLAGLDICAGVSPEDWPVLWRAG